MSGIRLSTHGTLAILNGVHSFVLSKRDAIELLAVDHDHRNGRVRALLCDKCNRAIGLLRDDPALIEAAAKYVRGFAS